MRAKSRGCRVQGCPDVVLVRWSGSQHTLTLLKSINCFEFLVVDAGKLGRIDVTQEEYDCIQV